MGSSSMRCLQANGCVKWIRYLHIAKGHIHSISRAYIFILYTLISLVPLLVDMNAVCVAHCDLFDTLLDESAPLSTHRCSEYFNSYYKMQGEYQSSNEEERLVASCYCDPEMSWRGSSACNVSSGVCTAVTASLWPEGVAQHHAASNPCSCIF